MVVRRCAEAADWQVVAPSHGECDLMDAAAVSAAVSSCGADAVVNCAAVSGLEACADDPSAARSVNAAAPSAMAAACRSSGARFVHLSTDYVLDGCCPGLKDEAALCHPVNVYGESKWEGERRVLDALPDALVLRVSWVCGNPQKPAFPESVLDRALAGGAVAAIDDKFSLPTDAWDIARVILALLPLPVGGIVHVCSSSPTPLSWHDVAVLALQAAVSRGALPVAPEVGRQSLSHASFFREKRPAHTAMDHARLRSWGVPMPTAPECLSRVVERYLSGRASDAC